MIPLRNGGHALVESAGEALKDWMGDLKRAAHDAVQAEPGFRMFSGPINLKVTFFLRRPKAHMRTGRRSGELKDSAPTRPIGRPDLDKLVRAAQDALEGIVFERDSQVVLTTSEKRYADQLPPGASVWVVGAP